MENTLERLKALPEMFEGLARVFTSFAVVEQKKDHSSAGDSRGKSFLLYADELEKLAMEIRKNTQRRAPLECISTLQGFFGITRSIFDAEPLWDEWKKEALPTFEKVGNESAQILDELRAIRKQNEQAPTP